MSLRNFGGSLGGSIGRALVLPALAVTLLATAAPAAAEAEVTPAKRTVNVNQASADELARLPRVGPSLAGRIVAHREQHGPFKRTEDLMEVKGVGEKMFAQLRPYLSTSGPTTLTEKVHLSSKAKAGDGAKASKGSKAAKADKATKAAKSPSPSAPDAPAGEKASGR